MKPYKNRQEGLKGKDILKCTSKGKPLNTTDILDNTLSHTCN